MDRNEALFPPKKPKGLQSNILEPNVLLPCTAAQGSSRSGNPHTLCHGAELFQQLQGTGTWDPRGLQWGGSATYRAGASGQRHAASLDDPTVPPCLQLQELEPINPTQNRAPGSHPFPFLLTFPLFSHSTPLPLHPTLCKHLPPSLKTVVGLSPIYSSYPCLPKPMRELRCLKQVRSECSSFQVSFTHKIGLILS